MTREKYYKIFADNAREIIIGNYSIDDRYIFTNIGKEKVINDFINHEQNTLKEFIEWYKKVLIKDYDDKANFGSVNLERNNDKDFWYFTGQCTAIQRLITLLDGDLKKFLEENDNADR